MKGIIIKKIESKSPDDPRGDVYELFQGFPGKQVTLYTRKVGQKFGNHFHKGDDPSKNPELFFLIDGKVKFYAKDGRTGEKIEEIIDEKTYIEIEPNIYHALEAVTDVTFVEYRSTLFDPSNPDSYSLDQYDEYIKSIK